MATYKDTEIIKIVYTSCNPFLQDPQVFNPARIKMEEWAPL